MGKLISGNGFSGCVRYLLGRDEAIIIGAENLNIQNAATITRDFAIQRSMNPEINKPVGHIILSWSNEDKEKLTPHIMAERAREYMKIMNIENTQYVIVQHTDKAHDHCHIVYNRIANNGKTIPDSNNYAANQKACKTINEKYGYTTGNNHDKGKARVNRQSLKGTDKVRYELYDAISKAAKTVAGWKRLEEMLKEQGIAMQFKYKGKTNEVQGVSFSQGEVKFKGSDIDKSFSYSKLNSQLETNLRIQREESKSLAEKLREVVAEGRNTQPVQPSQVIETPRQINIDQFPPGWFDLVQDLGNGIADDVDDEQQHKHKRARGRGR